MWQWLNPGPGGDDSAAAPVQRRSDGAAPQSADPRTIGARGTEGASTRLPYLDIIQRMFGRHDVSAVKARVGGAAAEASHALGAVAYTQGEQVAFATSPDLHTAAHEAAHVVQQRHGVAVTGGLDGGPGDPHEQHADAVADHVVRGESAEALLDQAGGGAAPNAAPVQRKASMQRVSDAAAPKPAGPEMYFTVHQTVLWRSVAAHLAQVPWPDPDPHFAWTDQPKFVAALMRSLERTVDLDKPAQLDEALYPAKATAVVHPLLPVKMETWVPAIGRAIGELFEDVILSSLTRLGPRWVAVAEHEPVPDGALDETKPLVRYDQLVKSAPIDRAVATGLTTRGVGQLVGATTTASLAKTKPHALRPVTVEWQGAKDRTLWNWVKATPSDATPEEVAAKLWQHAQGQYGEPTSFFAYGLTSVPPMFGLPPSWARGFREASEFAPTTSGDESQGARYLALAQSSLGDGLAVAQAPAATKSAAPTPKASLLVGTLADMTMQAQYLFATLSVWKQGAGAATLFQWLAAKQHQIATMEPAELGTWEPILAGQKARLTRIGTGIGQVVDAAGGMGIANADAPGAGALVDILGTYARAAALSHLHDTAEQLITRAAALQEGLAVKAVRGTANEMTAAVAGARQVIPDGPSVQLGKDASQVEDASRAIQSKLAAGEHVDESDVDEVTLRAREVTFDARTRTLLAQAQELRASAKQAGEGLASRIAARLHGSFKDLNTALATIWNDVGSIAQTREAEIAAFDREDTNPVDREQRRRTIRHERLKTAEAEFASLRANTEVMDFLKEGATIIKWQRFATACVDMLALIAVSIVASGAGALVAESIGSLMTGAGAAESVTELSAGARFVAGSARAVTEAAVNTGGQVAVQGGDVGEAFAENLLMTVGSMTVIDRLAKDLSLATKIEEQTAGLWAKVGRAGKVVLREGAAISLHTVSGAALGYVAHMVVTRNVTPLAMDLQDWFLQGASVALGRHAHDLVKARRPLHEKLELINELHAGDLAPLDGQLLRLGERAQTAPKPEDVAAILELRQHVLERELGALETLAGDEELQKRAHLGAADIQRLEGEARGALGEASGAGLGQVALQTSGLEPLIPDRVYKGMAAHLKHLEATAKRMGLSVLAEPQPDGTYRVTLDGKPFTVHVVEGGSAAKPGELEVKAPVPPVDEHAGKPNRAGFGHEPKEIREGTKPSEPAAAAASRLEAKGMSKEQIAQLRAEHGPKAIDAVDAMVKQGVEPRVALDALDLARTAAVEADVIELVRSGKLDNLKGLRRFLQGLAREVAQGAHGKREELREATTRAIAGHDVSLGGREFSSRDPGSGQADVVDFTDNQALQIKTVSSEQERAVSSNLDKALAQLRGTHKERPPAGAARIAKAIVENPANMLYAANRAQLLESLRTNMQNIESGENITIRVQNHVGTFDFTSDELAP